MFTYIVMADWLSTRFQLLDISTACIVAKECQQCLDCCFEVNNAYCSLAIQRNHQAVTQSNLEQFIYYNLSSGEWHKSSDYCIGLPASEVMLCGNYTSYFCAYLSHITFGS